MMLCSFCVHCRYIIMWFCYVTDVR